MAILVKSCLAYFDIGQEKSRWIPSVDVRIDESGTTSGKLAPLPGDEIIDGAKLIALPSMTNGHTHVAINYLRGAQYRYRDPQENIIASLMFRVEKHLTPDMIAALSRQGIAESLLSGVTQIIDHYYDADRTAQACVQLGMRGILSDTAQDLQGPRTSELDFERQFRFVDEWRGKHTLITPILGPHAPDSLSREKINALTAYARKFATPLHFHIAQSKWEVDTTRRTQKCSPVKFFHECGMLGPQSLAAHAIYVDDEDLRILAETKTSVAFCPQSQMGFARVAPLKKFKEHRINLLLGTDCVGSNDHMSLTRECSVCLSLLKMQYPLEPIDLNEPLDWCTRGPARWVGQKLSQDLVLLDTSQREYLLFPMDTPETCFPLQLSQFPARHVIVNGNFAVKDFRLTSANLADIERDAREVIAWIRKTVTA
jgi:5-methylthioadenosine/S-adenosylhomocysteine deaminase